MIYIEKKSKMFNNKHKFRLIKINQAKTMKFKHKIVSDSYVMKAALYLQNTFTKIDAK